MAGNVNTYGWAAPGRNEHRGCHTHSLELKLRRENKLQLLASTQTPPVLSVDFLGEPAPVTSGTISYCWKLGKARVFKVTEYDPQRRFLL